MNILSFGASTNSKSINRRFASHTANQISDTTVTDLDLRSFELPVFSVDEQAENGIPKAAQAFLDSIRKHDGIVVSLAEHNGSYTAAFKNLFDWTSRIEKEPWSGKPMLLLATSPGKRGAANVLKTARATFPYLGANLAAAFSLPSFTNNFDDELGITEPGLKHSYREAISAFEYLLKL